MVVGLARLSRHLFTGRFAVRRIFTEYSLEAVKQAIQQAEAGHEGEIRFAVEASLDTLPLLRDQSARARGLEVFSQLRVWDTEHNNGVLIYLLLADRDVEIIADRGIHKQVGDEKWETICGEMEAAFRQGQFEAGVIAGIHAVGNQLREYFPVKREDSANELSDSPVIL
jgi:uncharacterized membrane protein